MRIFITGATGFVGQHVIESASEAGHEIFASTLEKDKIENSTVNIRWIYSDLADLDSLKPALISFNPDIVIHLAWQGIPDYSELISRANLNNSINLLDFILSNTNCRKILVSGSCWEYGEKHGVCRESDSVNIDSYFTWAKHSLNQYLSVKCTKKKVILNWFRIFFVYGPGQRKESLIPTLIKSVGKSQIPIINNPMNKNDFVYVKDVARAFTQAVDANLPSGVYNLGSGYATSVYDACRIVEKQLLGTETIASQVLKNGQQTETVNFFADMEKTRQALDITCDTSFEEGIKLHIDYIHPKVTV